MKGPEDRPLGGVDYDTAKRLATSPDAVERRFVAGRAETRPEILYFLAADQSAEVRREIARNTSTPRQADLLLAADPDEGVRSSLAAKIASLVPHLPAEKVGQLEKLTLEVLETLARDQAVTVRRVLAETLKDQPGAPAQVVQQLARDLELSVSGPVLRHSPILTDEDLLQIIRAQPLDGALVAIAERAGLSGDVADAVARTDSEGAVAALLANHSAQIREETLDRIIEMAPRHEPWHGPLVRRPTLPPRAAARIAGFVNDQLLKVLQARPDLPEETRAAVSEAVRRRLPGLSAPAAAPRAGTAEALHDEEEEPKERPGDRARRLHAAGVLDEEVISDALSMGDRGFVLTALSLRAGIPLDTVDKIVGGQSPRGVTAVCWRAKLGMRFARQVQLRLAMIPPSAVMNAKDGTDYPMTEAEMKWQLEFFGVKV
ncbi:DUF2336 domain-containing protein [Rhodocista pekingensis]|uniref:DUF2336 domain-containing protein n=1 Tax=Rhodocista pekingensis TaxID=201185 RepID=A0ABW2KUM4_9PROT